MPPEPLVHSLDIQMSPVDVLARWPASMPLAALVSGEAPHATARSRWNILALPESLRVSTHALESDPLHDLPLPDPSLTRRVARATAAGSLPFIGGWIGTLSYELGGVIEPSAAAIAPGRLPPGEIRTPPSPFPIMTWVRCNRALLFDAADHRWYAIGGGVPGVLDRPAESSPAAAYRVSNLRPCTAPADYQLAVARVIEYIRAGDIFQANIAHRLEGELAGSPRTFFLDLLRAARPWYGGYLETPAGVICSASPELFLRFDAASRRIETRPMKGTADPARGPAALAHSPKDRAELNMIVDLMRNDLGRVCEFGSIRVDEQQAIEPHGVFDRTPSVHTPPSPPAAVLQGVATISGRVRPESTLRDVLRASFPPGSVTGAPKVRAMQIIEELERSPRGPYCGAIGYISDSGDAQFSVAIRTATIARREQPVHVGPFDPRTLVPSNAFRGTLGYHVGAGIVADSDPASEWEETMLKARALLTALGPESGEMSASQRG